MKLRQALNSSSFIVPTSSFRVHRFFSLVCDAVCHNPARSSNSDGSIARENMQTRLPWRLGIYASLLMMLLAAYPQAKVWLARGVDGSGAYAFFSEDEAAYCAYVN